MVALDVLVDTASAADPLAQAKADHSEVAGAAFLPSLTETSALMSSHMSAVILGSLLPPFQPDRASFDTATVAMKHHSPMAIE